MHTHACSLLTSKQIPRAGPCLLPLSVLPPTCAAPLQPSLPLSTWLVRLLFAPPRRFCATYRDGRVQERQRVAGSPFVHGHPQAAADARERVPCQLVWQVRCRQAPPNTAPAQSAPKATASAPAAALISAWLLLISLTSWFSCR